MQKDSMEKVEARTSHGGEIWERRSDSVVSQPPQRWVCHVSAPSSARMTHGGHKRRVGACQPGAERGRAVPRSRPRGYKRTAVAGAGPAAAMALRCLLLLLCGAALGPAVHLDFAEHRSQAAKIKVNPRGNLWATGTGRGARGCAGCAGHGDLPHCPVAACAEPPAPTRGGGCWQCHGGQGEAGAGVKTPPPASLGSRSNIPSRLTSLASLDMRFSIPGWHLCNHRDLVRRNREGSFPKILCGVRTWDFWVSLGSAALGIRSLGAPHWFVLVQGGW